MAMERPLFLLKKIWNFLKSWRKEEKYEIYGHSEEWTLRELEKTAKLPPGDLECKKEIWSFPRRLIQVQRSVGIYVNQTIAMYDIFSRSKDKIIGMIRIADAPEFHGKYASFPNPSDPLMRGECSHHGKIFLRIKRQ